VMRERKTPDDYHALASQRGLAWLGPEPRNVHTDTRWKCRQGHVWSARYTNIQQGYNCPFCARTRLGAYRRKTPADYRALAKRRGFIWLGPEVFNNQTKTGWQCPQGHRWQGTYGNIAQGHGCRDCSYEERGRRRRKTPADYRAVAQQRGFTWTGPKVTNVGAKTGWRCSEGHCWQNSYGQIQQGDGCPLCARFYQGRFPRKTAADYRALARQRGITWIGPEVRNVRARTGWKCRQGHQWQSTHNSIQQGSGCPMCARGSGREKSRRAEGRSSYAGGAK
jgi:hypothetical protein